MEDRDSEIENDQINSGRIPSEGKHEGRYKIYLYIFIKDSNLVQFKL